MFGTKPNTYSINTNFNDVDFRVSTKQILKVIKRNPNGINLTDIVRTLQPDFDFDLLTKHNFSKAIQPLVVNRQVKAILHEKSGRVKMYKPMKPSKRVIFAQFIKDITA